MWMIALLVVLGTLNWSSPMTEKMLVAASVINLFAFVYFVKEYL